ncbi:unnamed protein product [Linum trigynum]
MAREELPRRPASRETASKEGGQVKSMLEAAAFEMQVNRPVRGGHRGGGSSGQEQPREVRKVVAPREEVDSPTRHRSSPSGFAISKFVRMPRLSRAAAPVARSWTSRAWSNPVDRLGSRMTRLGENTRHRVQSAVNSR